MSVKLKQNFRNVIRKLKKFRFRRVIRRNDGAPYLIRYYLLWTPWWRLRLHHILLSDYDCLHDHPWAFKSIILAGGYTEHLKVDPKDPDSAVITRWYDRGSVLKRKAEDAHRLELPEGKSCWSLVFMYKRTREWGFFTKAGKLWVKWFHYVPTQTCE